MALKDIFNGQSCFELQIELYINFEVIIKKS